jgi:hypothetical protein
MVWGLVFRVKRFMAQSSEFRILGFGFWAHGLGYRVRAQASGFRV